MFQSLGKSIASAARSCCVGPCGLKVDISTTRLGQFAVSLLGVWQRAQNGLTGHARALGHIVTGSLLVSMRADG